MELNHRSFVRVQEMFGEMSNDNRILAVALNYSHGGEREAGRARPVVIVSKDVLVRIKADVLGIRAGLSVRSSRVTASESIPAI